MATTTTTSTKQTPLPPPPTRRSISHDSVTQTAIALEKARKNSKSTTGPKKGSSHADVIDRLDFTGVGPSAYSPLSIFSPQPLTLCEPLNSSLSILAIYVASDDLY